MKVREKTSEKKNVRAWRFPFVVGMERREGKGEEEMVNAPPPRYLSLVFAPVFPFPAMRFEGKG